MSDRRIRDLEPKDFLWVLKALPDKVFVAFDTETTGLDPVAGRIVEIGAVKFTKDCILGTFEELINPGMPMPPEVTKINGIGDDLVAGKPPAAQVIPRFVEFASGAILVAHNAPFDIGFVDAELSRLSLTRLAAPSVDTRLLARAAFPGRPGGSYALQTLAKDFSLPVENAHRALDDARVCMSLFFLCIQKIEAEVVVAQ